jgi:hypothetical protein
MVNEKIMKDFRDEFPKLVDEYIKAHDDFYEKGLRTTSTRARMILLKIKEMCQKARLCIQEDRNSFKNEKTKAGTGE